jgi:hypothetical protein
MSTPARRPATEITPIVLGVVTIISGAATGLFSDLRLLGKIVGLAALALWIIALGALLVRLGRESDVPRRAWAVILAAFVLTAALLVIALQTGPRLNARTLLLSERGARNLASLCSGLGGRVAADVALSQLGDQFIHVELRDRRCRSGDADVRIRTDDVLAVLPAR